MKNHTLTFLMGSLLVGVASWAQTPAAGASRVTDFQKKFFEEGRAIGHQLDGLITFSLSRDWALRDGVNLRPGFDFGILGACPKNVVPESCVPPTALADGWKTLDVAASGGLALAADLKSLGRGYDNICIPTPSAYGRLQNVEARLARWVAPIQRVSRGQIVVAARSGMNLQALSASESASGSTKFRSLSRQKRQLARDAIEAVMGRCGPPPDESDYSIVKNVCSSANCEDPNMNCGLASCCDPRPSHCPLPAPPENVSVSTSGS